MRGSRWGRICGDWKGVWRGFWHGIHVPFRGSECGIRRGIVAGVETIINGLPKWLLWNGHEESGLQVNSRSRGTGIEIWQTAIVNGADKAIFSAECSKFRGADSGIRVTEKQRKCEPRLGVAAVD